MKIKITFQLLTGLCVALLLFNCEDFEEETFQYSPMEAAAAELMQDTLWIEYELPDVSDFTGGISDPVGAANSTDIIPVLIDSLEANNISIAYEDSLFLLVTDAEIDTNYFVYHQASNVKTAFFFNQNLYFELYDTAVNLLDSQLESYPLDQIAGGIQYHTDETQNVDLVYHLSTSSYHDLNTGTYLIRIIKTDLTGSDNIRMVVKTEN